MDVSLKIDGDQVLGEFAVLMAPGTVADKRDRMLDELLTEPLFDVARQLGAVLTADPHDYVRVLNGHDDKGRTRFAVRGRVEGDWLMPVGKGKRRSRG